MTYDDFVKLMPGIAAIIAIIGSILGAYFTFRFNASRNNKIDRFNRMENCYILFHQYYNLMTAGTFPWQMVRDGGISYDKANDMLIESVKESPKDLYPKIRFTVLLFPELLSLLDDFKKCNDSISKKLNEAKNSYKRDGDLSVFQKIDWVKYGSEMDELRNKIDQSFNIAIKRIKI